MDGHTGIAARRHALLPLLFCPDVSRLRGDVVDPVKFGMLLEQDSQLVLPTLIVRHMPMVAQVLFSAPSVALSENGIKPMLSPLNGSEFFRPMRVVLVGFAVTVLAIALWSDASIYKLVVTTY